MGNMTDAQDTEKLTVWLQIANKVNNALVKEMPVGKWHARQVNPGDVADDILAIFTQSLEGLREQAYSPPGLQGHVIPLSDLDELLADIRGAR